MLGKSVLFLNTLNKSANLIGQPVFNALRQSQKTSPRRLKKKNACCFMRLCANSHWFPLFSHEVLNVGDKRVRLSSWCGQAIILVFSIHVITSIAIIKSNNIIINKYKVLFKKTCYKPICLNSLLGWMFIRVKIYLQYRCNFNISHTHM